MYWYKNLPNQEIYSNLKKRDSPSARLQRTFIEFLLLLFLGGIAYFLFSGFSYVDVRDQCFIKVKYDVLKGDRESIIEALEILKAKDYVFYRKFCSNVSEIYERRCTMAEKSSSKVEFIKTDGCYIKGSHAIIIEPIDGAVYDIVDRRVKTIKKHGEFAINYWEEEHSLLHGE